jgi:hypothetical protein
LLDRPDINWDDVRTCQRGEPSPLRHLASLTPSRAQLVRRWVARLGARWHSEVWAIYRAGQDQWELDWLPNSDGHPTKADLIEALDDDPDLGVHRDALVVGTTAGAAARWAARMLKQGVAVIVDTETTDLDGAIIEIAIIDTDGTVLVDTLINPGPVPIAPEARQVHGLSQTDLADAPTWPDVLPHVLAATEGKTILAWGATFDASVILADCQRHALDPAHLADNRWGCIMDRRSDWERSRHWSPLGGPHRALGDTQAALDELQALARRPPT